MDLRQQLSRAASHLNSGHPVRCIELCNELLTRAPGQPDIHHLRGMAAAAQGDAESAIADLALAWKANRQNNQAAFWLGRLLRQQERYTGAIAPLSEAKNATPFAADASYELARVLTRLRRVEDAIAEYRQVLKLQPEHTDAAANLAFLLERANQLAESEGLADQTLSRAPDHILAGLTKATLERRSGRVDSAADRLRQLLGYELAPMNRSIALNQLAQCLELQRNYGEAFRHYQQSNHLLRTEHPHGQPVHDGSYGAGTLNSIIQWLDRNPCDSWSAAAEETDSPVFMVGFPRSGTTLMDQALAAHPAIEVLEEQELLDEVRRRYVDGDAIQQLDRLSGQDIAAAKSLYFEALNRQRKHADKPVIVDKLPLNLPYLFLIHRLFPNASILFMMRDPRDACLSCFFQTFDLQGAMPYFLEYTETTRYYDLVMRLATKTIGQISNPVKMVRYESLVSQFETEMREVLDFMNVDWHPDVMSYRQKAASRIIDTPSYQQVVKPLYTGSIGRWRKFATETEPGLALLGPWIEEFDYPES